MTDDTGSEALLRFARIIAADGYGRGLQPVQWQALIYLDAANRFSRTPKGLTDWLGQTKGSVSQTIIALEKKGFVSRRADKQDNRVVRLDLTEEGRSMLATAPVPMSGQMLGELSDQEQSIFCGLVGKMLINSIAKNGGKPFGICRQCRHFQIVSTPEHSFRCDLLGLPLSEEDSGHICVEQEPT